MCFGDKLQIPLITSHILQSTIILVQIILAFHILSSMCGCVVKKHALWSLLDLASSFALLLVPGYQGNHLASPSLNFWSMKW